MFGFLVGCAAAIAAVGINLAVSLIASTWAFDIFWWLRRSGGHN